MTVLVVDLLAASDKMRWWTLAIVASTKNLEEKAEVNYPRREAFVFTKANPVFRSFFSYVTAFQLSKNSGIATALVMLTDKDADTGSKYTNIILGGSWEDKMQAKK